MAQSSLRTLPQQIASAGLTVDGREISEQDIDDIVETYNPSLYGARINLDHYGNWGAWAAQDIGIDLNGCMLGDVISVAKGKAEDGTTVLTAVLCPNESLLKLNQADQAVYYSIEINRDFMGTGKTYLTGLAMTDYPASTRTTRANFNKNANQEDEKQRFQLELEMQQEKSWLSKVFNFNKTQTQAQEDSDMTNDQIVQLGEIFTNAIKPLNTQLTSLSAQLDSFTANAGGNNETNEQENGTDPKETSDEQGFAKQDKELKEMQSQFTAMQESLASLNEQFQKAIKEPGTNTTEAEDEQTGENSQFNGTL